MCTHLVCVHQLKSLRGHGPNERHEQPQYPKKRTERFHELVDTRVSHSSKTTHIAVLHSRTDIIPYTAFFLSPNVTGELETSINSSSIIAFAQTISVANSALAITKPILNKYGIIKIHIPRIAFFL